MCVRYTHLVKLLLIGDSSVGKTAVLLRYALPINLTKMNTGIV
jgi:hypothetical protein